MTQKHLQFSFGFAFLFIIQILLETDSATAVLVFEDFRYAVKPLITISLMGYLAYRTQLKGRFSKRIFIGLIFGLIGDSLLMFVHIDDLFFILGLIAFLLGHISYLTAFFLDYSWARKIEKTMLISSLLIFTLFCAAFYWYLQPHLGSLKIPVLIYAIVISAMAMMAFNRKGRVNKLSFSLICFGVAFFLCSDSLLAYNKFVKPVPFSGAFVMATYMIAQYLITIGAIDRKLKKHSVITR